MEIWIKPVYMAVSWALFGLIWIVQLVHYPSFRFISDDKWQAFHQHHSRSISIIVMPLMLIELGMSTYFLYYEVNTFSIINGILVGIIWLNTFLQAVPLHGKLEGEKNIDLINKLVKINWIRTVLWTLKAGLVSNFLF